MEIITISRQSGSLGREIAEQLSLRLNMQLIIRDKVLTEWMPEIANPYELTMLSKSAKFYLSASRDGICFKDHIEKKLKDETAKKPAVILGMGSQIIFSDHPEALNIRIIASDKTRLKRFGEKYGLSGNEAEKLLQQSDKRHKRYISTLYGADWSDPLHYDMILNTDKMFVDQCAELITLQLEAKKRLKFFKAIDDKESANADNHRRAVFKHPAEEEFANILDMYGIAWEYEPKTFPVKWDAEGNVTMAFSPDFYLTKFDTYIEITTMEQKYVSTKNKKVKLLRELYPGISINIVYKKDFYSLLERFGFSGSEEIKEFNRSLE